MGRNKDWVTTPGFEKYLKEVVSYAAESLKSLENYDPVLIAGPTGAGKSYVLEKILEAAGIEEKDKVVVNCAAFTETLIESELFGHVKGAFTGAVKDSEGLLGNTKIKVLVLDEVGTLPKHLQAKLLSFLDSGMYLKVGGNENPTSDIMIVGTTNSKMEKKDVREDFLYRFKMVRVPGLHSRREDIPFLLNYFAPNVNWTKGDMLRLMAYNWPGNFREFRRFAELVRRNWERIEAPGSHWGSILLWFQKPENSKVGFGSSGYVDMPKFRPLGDLRQLFGPRKALLKKIDQFTPSLSPRESILDEFEMRDRLEPGGGSDGIAKKISTGEGPNSDEEIDDLFQESEKSKSSDKTRNEPAVEYVDIKYDWYTWCRLFHQNPNIDKDILQCILQKNATYEEFVIDGRYNITGEPEFDALVSELGEFLYPSKSGLNHDKNGLLNAAIEAVLDKFAPEKYKEKWIEYHSSSGPKKIAEKFNLKYNTVKSWFYKYAKKEGG